MQFNSNLASHLICFFLVQVNGKIQKFYNLEYNHTYLSTDTGNITTEVTIQKSTYIFLTLKGNQGIC